MKITMGPYIEWWGPYQVVHLLTYLGFSQNTVDKWAEKFPEWITDACLWVHNKRNRTIKVRIDKYDVWSMDSTLAPIILPMLKLLKEDKKSIPFLDVLHQVSRGYQRCFPFYSEGDDTVIDAGEKEWNAILDKMIWSFEQLIAEPDMEYVTDPLGIEKMAKHQKKVSEGLILFGTHYRNLWS